jgi:hypothetical protein
LVNIINKVTLKITLTILMISMMHRQDAIAQGIPVHGKTDNTPYAAPASVGEQIKYGVIKDMCLGIGSGAISAAGIGGKIGYNMGHKLLTRPPAFIENMYYFYRAYNVYFCNRYDLGDMASVIRMTAWGFPLLLKDIGSRGILALTTTTGVVLGGLVGTVSGAITGAVIGGITHPLRKYFYPDNLEVTDATVPVEMPTPSAVPSSSVDELAPAKEEESVGSDQPPSESSLVPPDNLDGADATVPTKIPKPSGVPSPLIDESAVTQEEENAGSNQLLDSSVMSASILIVEDINHLFAAYKAQLMTDFQQLDMLYSQIDAGNKKLNMMNDKIDQLQKDIQKNNKKAVRGIAAVAALGSAVLSSEPGKTVVSAGVGNYDGVQGLAISITHRSERMSHISVQGGLGASSGGKPLMRLGASYEF